MATMTSKRFALNEIKRALEYISIANSYGTDVGSVHTNIFGREDVRVLGALPAIGFMTGRTTVAYDGFGEMRCLCPLSVTAVVSASSWSVGATALDTLEDDIIAALMNVPVLGNDLVSIHFMGSEDDTGSPDTADSRGGTMATVLFFDIIWRRSKDREIT